MKKKCIFLSTILLCIVLSLMSSCSRIEETTSSNTITFGYDCLITYSYLPYTADSAQINLRIQIDNAIEREGGHLDYYDTTKVYVSDPMSEQYRLLIEHNQFLPLETSTKIYLGNDAMYKLLIRTHKNAAYKDGANEMSDFIIPIQVHKGEVSSIAQQDVSQKENVPILISNYHTITTSSTIIIE